MPTVVRHLVGGLGPAQTGLASGTFHRELGRTAGISLCRQRRLRSLEILIRGRLFRGVYGELVVRCVE